MQNFIQTFSNLINIKCLSFISDFKDDLYLNFIKEDRWKYIAQGLGTTLKITFLSLILGIIIGSLIAIIRSTYDKHYDEMRSGFGRVMLKLFNMICKLYLTVIRGTPVVIQILIMYYVVFMSSNNKLLVAVLAFGINSGAYVAEIVRSGIMSIDEGQFEAGRSLGFNYIQTMSFIIIPQAIKVVLPTLGNEFIVLLKETAVSGYIALEDLTRGGDIIRSRTYSAFMPFIAVALIYLVLVMMLEKLIGSLERRLRNDER